jgi:hypothetical protein
MLEANIDLWGPDEIPLLQTFLDALQAHRNVKYPDYATNVGAAEDVPPVPLEQVIDEAHAATPRVVAAAPELAAPYGTTPVTESDAVAAFLAAVARGVSKPAIEALLAEKGVARVTQLGDADRGSFVAALGALNSASSEPSK